MVTFPWFKAFQKKTVISMGIQSGFPIFLNVSRETIILNKFILVDTPA